MSRRLPSIVAVLALLAAALAGAQPASASEHLDPPTDEALPIVFVHGGAGSAAQYRTQQMRFASNGYPNVVRAIDRPAGVDFNEMFDEYLDELLAETGDDQVYVLGHSLGTFIMNTYLNSSPERADRVAKYISLDGMPANCGSVPTECTNITAAGLGGQGHTEAVTSPESFVEQYEFLTGDAPATTAVVAEERPEISGRVISFPDNHGPGAGTLKVWEIDSVTGHRTGTDAYATFTFDDDDAGPDQDAGRWGPLEVDPDTNYEFELVREGFEETTVHYYLQPLERSTDAIRLLVTGPDAPTTANTEVGPDHSAVVAIRYKEWFGNAPEGGNDSLTISTTSTEGPGDPEFPREQPPVEVINPSTAPAPGGISSAKIGVHLHDVGSDGVTGADEAIPFFAGVTFQTGADIFMPASETPDGTIHMVSAHRGDVDRPQVVNTPNWPSDSHRVVVELNDYLPEEPALPIVFVHGGSGSAAQYQSQAMRFASNGYPNVVTGIDRISAEHDVIAPILDDFFDDVMAQTGDDQVYVVGHSQGVSVMNNYLNSSPERVARVAKYIGIDSGSGVSREVCPGNAVCKGIFGEGDPARRLGPYNSPQYADQGHTQAVVSPESFVEQYRFFTGQAPATTEVVPTDDVEISGKAINFPANTAPEGTTVRIWPVDGDTGHRIAEEPHAEFDLDETTDGGFGPVAVDPEQHYEFELLRDDTDRIGHFYREPFVRDNHLIRLLVPPDALLNVTDTSEDHSSVVAIRYKEWRAGHPTEADDSLLIGTELPNGGGRPPVEAINTATAPVANRTIGIHLFDEDADGVTDVSEPIAPFFALPFQTGVDVFMPASESADGSIGLRSVPRTDTDQVQEINVPNWPSDVHRIAAEFNDYVVDEAETVSLAATLGPEGAVETEGSGHADVEVDVAGEELCVEMEWRDLTSETTAAHIHLGASGAAGPVVIPLPVDQERNCVDVEADVLEEVLADPTGYYVNVHTTQNPGGEIRGQLEVSVTHTARFSEQVCANFGRIAGAMHFTSTQDLIRTGVRGFVRYAEAGEAEPIADPSANEGPCVVQVTWPESEAAAVAEAAAAWGVDADHLHHGGGRLMNALVFLTFGVGGSS